MKCKTCHGEHVMGKMKKKVNLGVLRISPCVSNGVSRSCLDPIRFNRSKHAPLKKNNLDIIFKCQLDCILAYHQVFHNAESLETWIQHDSHHVVNLPCIKRLQKLQKRFNYLYHLQPHVLLKKQDLNFKLVKYFKPTIKL